MDPELPNEKILEKQIRQEIKMIKIQDPELAKAYEEEYLKKNYIDEILTAQYDTSEVKFYPGSDKGPLPEDDPEAYSRWFVENQPKKAFAKYTDQHDFAELGVKSKIVQITKDTTDTHEQKLMSDYFIEEDEEYPLATYDGTPEFDIYNRDCFTVQNEEELPSMSFSTQMRPHELAPMPTDHTMIYQDVHYELERWTIFRALPSIMAYDQSMLHYWKGVQNGTLRLPDFVYNINPPSLFAYYNTLPQWARDHPAVRNVLMAFEYHQPLLDFRKKEIAMNYAMSFIRPIDP